VPTAAADSVAGVHMNAELQLPVSSDVCIVEIGWAVADPDDIFSWE
jgi:hypothetical protein